MKKFLFLASTILFFAGCSSDDDVSPVVNPETKNPVATADAVSTSENEELKIAKDFLLENDEIVDLSRISDFDSETTEGGEVVIVTEPFHISHQKIFREKTVFPMICVCLEARIVVLRQ